MEFNTEKDLANAVAKLNNYPLDKSHNLSAYSFKTFSDAMATPDTFKLPDDKFEAKVPDMVAPALR